MFVATGEVAGMAFIRANELRSKPPRREGSKPDFDIFWEDRPRWAYNRNGIASLESGKGKFKRLHFGYSEGSFILMRTASALPNGVETATLIGSRFSSRETQRLAVD